MVTGFESSLILSLLLLSLAAWPPLAIDGGDGRDDAAAANADADADAGNVDGPLAVTVALWPLLHNTTDMFTAAIECLCSLVTAQLPLFVQTIAMRAYRLFDRRTKWVCISYVANALKISVLISTICWVN